MIRSHIALLFPLIDTFIDYKEEILSNWMAQESVGPILEAHDIELLHFRDQYASGVFDYFIHVILGEQELGACPVMEAFLNYLKNRDVHANELYILCSHFKKTMVDFSYDHHIDSKEMFAAISYLFDANFSSILSLYTDTIYQKEQVIAKNLAQLNAYKQAIDKAVIVSKTDLEGRITYVNDNFLKVSGFSREELMGQNHNIVRHPDTDEAVFKKMWETIKSDHIYQGIIQNQNKKKESYFLEVTIVPLSEPMQGTLEYISIAYDITTLVMARRVADEASKAKEQFLSAMSHEIRTPLNAILGFVSLLQEQTTNDLHRHYLEIISHSGTHLLHIINDILDFSKLTQNYLVINPTLFNLKESLKQLLPLFAKNAEQKALNFQIRYLNELPEYIWLDEVRLSQIISNLLSNAIKFTPQKGSVTVFIATKAQELIIKVEDSGIGMSKAAQKEVFKPFIQAKASHEGTGLGLAITKELVEAMQGRLHLESAPLKGSTFSVSLPFKEATQEELAGIQKPKNPPKRSFKAKVLVAEDNSDNQELIAIYLKNMGLSVFMVSNGKEAIEAHKKEDFDFIILDDEMPELKGHEAALGIRNSERLHHKKPTPMAIISANITLESKKRAIEHGVDAFLTKPVTQEELQKLLSRFLKPKSELLMKHSLRMGLDEQEVLHLFELFKKNRNSYLKQLFEAIEHEDLELIERIAHKIKGSAGNFHFEELSHSAQTLESYAQQKTKLNYKRLYYKLKKLYEEASL